jgi:hypothetical protein
MVVLLFRIIPKKLKAGIWKRKRRHIRVLQAGCANIMCRNTKLVTECSLVVIALKDTFKLQKQADIWLRLQSKNYMRRITDTNVNSNSNDVTRVMELDSSV